MIATKKPTVRRMAITKARTNFSNVMRRVHSNKECFVIEKDGIPVAGIIGVDELEDYLELQDEDLKKQIAQGFEEYKRGKTQNAREFIKELETEMKQTKGKKKAA
ncbi:MAG: type II toxin-antitoxin system Phd/YefM family antitoxin [Bacteroidota bacterium]